MEQMGEFTQGEAIVMQLEARIAQIDTVISDEEPKWSIIGVGPLFFGQIANGKMKQEETDGAFSATQVVGDWEPGTYLMTWDWKNLSGEQRIERLLTIGSLQKKEEMREKLEAESLAHFYEMGEEPDYLPVVSESLPYQTVVEGDEIVIRLQSDLSPNHEYRLYVPEALLGHPEMEDAYKVYAFDSLARPLYIRVGEVKRELAAFGKGVEERSILSRIREAGLKAHQLKSLDSNAQDTAFEMMEEDEDEYYPLTRFVLYETLLQVSDALISDWLMGNEMNSGLLDSIKRYQIADLTVESGGTSDSEAMSTALKMLDKKKQSWEEQLSYWKDAMMGYRARGYAKARTSSFRIIGGDAPSREI